MTLSLRTKLSLCLGLLVLLCLGALATVAGRWVEHYVLDLQARRLQGEAQRLATALDIGLYERLREVTNLAASVNRLPATGLHREDIERLQRTYPHYAWIGLTDATGRVVTSTRGVLEGANVSARPWWRQGRAGPTVLDVHDALLLKPYLSPTTDGGPPRLLDVAAPIVIDGQTVGVLGAHLDWEWARELYARMLADDDEDGIEVLIFNAQGTDMRLQSASGVGRTLPAQARDGVSQVVDWGDAGRFLTAAVTREGYRTYEGLGWSVVVRQPAAVVLVPARDRVRLAWASSAAIGVVLMAGIWLAAGRLLQPLRRAAAQAAVVVPARGDEAHQLSAALSALVAQLRTREAELIELNTQLDRKVEDRTAELARRNGELAALARAITHDIRAPILSTAQFLELTRHGEPEALRRACDAAIRECRHVGDVVDSLHALMSSDQRPLARTQVDMTALAKDAARRQQLATRFDGEVSVDDMPPAVGDPVLLGEVWENLIGNAMKYAAQVAAPVVRVSGHVEGEEVCFRVTDNGIGFEPTQGDRLFAPFTRLVADASFKGTGLGLAIVKRIVERHGGRVGAQGRPGEGATFSVWLPRSPDV